MTTLKKAMIVLPLLTACGMAPEDFKTSSERDVPQRGSINEYGQIKVTSHSSSSYSLEVIPFERLAFYKIVISESADSPTICERYSSDSTQVLKIEKSNFNPEFLHFARVCVYFDEGDSGVTSLVLANDKLLIAISRETLIKLK